MSDYHAELLVAAQRLLARRSGQRGRLPAARVRRSVSTAYYALFHFLSEECGHLVIGTIPILSRRRRIFARVLSHQGMKQTFKKVIGTEASADIAEFLREQGPVGSPVTIPPFARTMARTFIQVQDQRHQADYNLESNFTAIDAARIIGMIETAIQLWSAATSPEDRRFKQGLCLLMVLRGKLRTDDS